MCIFREKGQLKRSTKLFSAEKKYGFQKKNKNLTVQI